MLACHKWKTGGPVQGFKNMQATIRSLMDSCKSMISSNYIWNTTWATSSNGNFSVSINWRNIEETEVSWCLILFHIVTSKNLTKETCQRKEVFTWLHSFRRNSTTCQGKHGGWKALSMVAEPWGLVSAHLRRQEVGSRIRSVADLEPSNIHPSYSSLLAISLTSKVLRHREKPLQLWWQCSNTWTFENIHAIQGITSACQVLFRHWFL